MDNQKTTTLTSSFLTLANEEYDALATYCNSLSILSHSIHNPQRKNDSFSTNIHIRNSSSSSTSLDPNLFLNHTSTFFQQSSQQQQIKDALQTYQDSLDKLQSIHSNLIQCHDKLQNQYAKQNQYDNNQTYSYICDAISNHLGLSTRVLKTCSSFMKTGYGPFYENGILKNVGGGNTQDFSSDSLEDWYEIRIVSLTVYRASVARLKQIINNNLEMNT